MSNRSPTRPWWQRVRVSLRALMGLVLIFACVLGWFIHRARVQREAVAAITRAGGNAMYEWQYKNGRPFTQGEPPWPKWLVGRFGIDYFGNVVFVFLPEGGADAEMAHVGRLGRLERLWVRSPQVTDEGVRHLQGLSHLHDLRFADSEVSDAGLVYLEGLKGLRQVSFYNTRVTDAGLAGLQAGNPEVEIAP